MKAIGTISLFVLMCVVFLILGCKFSYEFCIKLDELTKKTVKKLGLAKEHDPFWTSQKHKEKLGIEILECPQEEEQLLHSLIEKTIKAGFRYYETGEEKELEVVRSFFLPEEYERIKRNLTEIGKERRIVRETFECNCEVPVEMPKIRFSEPRKYKDMENRIGIMSLVNILSPSFLKSGCVGELFHIFVFRSVNKEWKIERVREVGGVVPPKWLEIEETLILEEIR